MKNWRTTPEHRLWRIIIIRRDKVCAVCGTRKKRQAHHKNSGSYFPEERFDPENGVVLCYSCHMNFHCNFKRSYREKCTKYDFDNFMVLCEYIKTLKE
jgi:5-methylcytosine-specific restriction endonuclease McrA